MPETMLAIGLMSGTSLDGVDAALIETDGEAFVRPVAFRGQDYSDAARARLAEATALALTYDRPRASAEIVAATELITRTHALAVHELLRRAELAPERIGVVGFHGQTVAHRPDRSWTWQIGDGEALARAAGIDVVDDFRSADVAAGGQGAPLLPVYHRALASGLDGPVAVLNLGGVANVTLVDGDELSAFDTGPANGLIDSWVEQSTGARYDADGALAARGQVHENVLAAMLDHPYFEQPPPKSLDRNDFTIQPARGLSVADGAATLTAFTAATVAAALERLPVRPRRLLVAGGGRRNPTMLRMIEARTGLAPEPAETLGWNGDALEAEGFAYMAVRRLRQLPISFPGTTGAPRAMTGGMIRRAVRPT